MSKNLEPVDEFEVWYLERLREMNNAMSPAEIERVLDQVREQVIAKRCFAYWLSEARSHAEKVLRRNGWERGSSNPNITEKKASGMTYNERNRRVRHLWKIGLNTFEIAETLSLSESDVERIVFEYLNSRKPKRSAA